MNGHLVKYLAQEKGISIKEAEKVYEKRKNFRRYFKDLDFKDLDFKDFDFKGFDFLELLKKNKIRR